MKTMTPPIKIKYAPTLIAALSFFVLILLNMLLFFGRKKEALQSRWLIDTFTDFYQHISNFSIGLTIYSMVGFTWLMMGVSFRYIAAMGIVIIFINAVYELWIPVLNTRDVVDAYYGIAGVVTGFILLAIIHKYGLKPYDRLSV